MTATTQTEDEKKANEVAKKEETGTETDSKKAEAEAETEAKKERKKEVTDSNICANCGRVGGYKKSPDCVNCARCDNKIIADELLAKENEN